MLIQSGVIQAFFCDFESLSDLISGDTVGPDFGKPAGNSGVQLEVRFVVCSRYSGP